MSALSDDDLLVGLRSGEPAAISLLFERYRRRLYSYCAWILADTVLAEDVVQNLFATLSSRELSLEKVVSLRPWLFRVARNKCMKELQLRKRGHLSLDANGIWDEENPFDILVKKETGQAIREAVSHLQTIYREAIILREFEEMSYSQIAETVGVPLSTVKFRIFKARDTLIRLLRAVGEERRSGT